ncbi:MAG: glycine zipper 2TM domain-containing protein [Pseudomonadota bacterium]
MHNLCVGPQSGAQALTRGGARTHLQRLRAGLVSRVTAMVAVLVLAVGCASPYGGPNQTGGTLLGAAAGGLIGSTIGSGSGQLAATAIGTLVGAGIGNAAGAQIDATNYYPNYYHAGYYAPYGYAYRGDPHHGAYLVGQPPKVSHTVHNNVFSVPAVQYEYPTYREVVWSPVSDVTVYQRGTAPLSLHGCTQVANPDGRMLRYCPDRFGGWSYRP